MASAHAPFHAPCLPSFCMQPQHSADPKSAPIPPHAAFAKFFFAILFRQHKFHVACSTVPAVGKSSTLLQVCTGNSFIHTCSCRPQLRCTVPSSPEGPQHHLLSSTLASLLPSLPLPLPWTPLHICTQTTSNLYATRS